MIFYNTGKTGSGKTQYSVIQIHKFWKKGKDVWTNTPLFFTSFNNGFSGENIVDDPKYFKIWERIFFLALKWTSKAFKKEIGIKRRGRIQYFETIDEVFHVKDAVIFFDEGQTLFRNYDYETVPRMFLYKLEQNRKHGLDMITTAQRPMAININYRYLVQSWSHFETILDIKRFIHIYRHKVKDVDYMDENLQEKDIPDIKRKGLIGISIKGFWSKVFRLYDTYYDIGFTPFQHYQVNIGNEKVKLHLENGMSVKEAMQKINQYIKIHNLDV